MDQHRVCSLIKYLNYKELTKILPKEKLFTKIESKGGKTPCPTLAKNLGASNYGLFVEKVVEVLIDNDFNIEALNVLKNILPPILQKNFNIEAWQPLSHLLKQEFKHVKCQAELQDFNNHIVGHPDLMTDNVVYDIKTTGRFGAMRIHCIFQLLSYYCLSKINKLSIDTIGLVLPLQLQIVKYNISSWDWKPFYHALIDCITEKMIQSCLWDIDSFLHDIFVMQIEENVGFHCHNEQLVPCMKKNIPALQFFVNGNVNGNVKFDKKFMNQLNIQTKSKIYIHSPYILNLSHPGKNSKGSFEHLGEYSYGGYTFDCLTKLLQYGRAVKAKGIVVHLGKTCGESYEESVINMYFSVMACSLWATKECKLLLETCCDQKGEILADPNELCDFYLSLPDCVREVVAICVDTCHVNAASYNAYEYIKILEQRNVPIDLIHYNDSKMKCACRVDRHAMIGEGYLGYDTLNAVLQYGILHNIPMLRE